VSWITDVAPKIKILFERDAPDNLWIKCPDSGQVVFQKDFEANQWVIPGSGHHMRLSALQRLTLTFDEGQWIDVPVLVTEADPLKFRDTKRYSDRLKEGRTKTGLPDAIKVGTGTVERIPMTVAAHDPEFIGGSLGMAAGEAFIRGAEAAIERATPYVAFTASGGARMQEGLLSLMQMACPYGRAWGPDRLCRSSGNRPDDPRALARRVSEGRVSEGPWHGRHGGPPP
jgi:acetyl-CoA carboxylase carboxyl transferase subunit beta